MSTPRLPIVAFGPNPWEGFWMNRQQLLSRLGRRGWPVVYTIGPMTVWERGGPRWQQADWLSRGVAMDGVVVDRPGRLAARWPKLPLWDQAVYRLHARHLLKLAGLRPGQRGILFFFHPDFVPYIAWMGQPHVAFHAFDMYAQMTPGWTESQMQQEAWLCRRADLLTTISDTVRQAMPPPGPEKARILLNGTDIDTVLAADHQPCPADLAAIPRPRIGYVGQITPKIDFRTILEVARQRPQWHWALVGNVKIADRPQTDWEIRAKADLEACRAMPNIHFLGVKPYGELPVYIRHMDVNTIIYRAEPGWWAAGYPQKLHDYLGSMVPLVSPAFATLRELSGVVGLVEDDVSSWIGALQRAIREGGPGDPGERRAIAMENSWDRRVDLLEEWLFEMVSRVS
ncbi:MAG: hypothetical protein HQL56_02835 [Magnetococcales bacterium]|nr:hypothetical protein [Magnetococcales bacterium]